MIKLIQGPISCQLIAEICHEGKSNSGIGAQTLFLGQVRADKSFEKTVKGIEYSAYPIMTEKLMNELASDCINRHQLMAIHLVHSVGFVPVGDLSLLVQISTKHRKLAFQILEEIVETIKFDIPLWKKEIFEDNSSRWIEDSKRSKESS